MNSLLNTALAHNLIFEVCLQELFVFFRLTLSVIQYLEAKCNTEFALTSIAMLRYGFTNRTH